MNCQSYTYYLIDCINGNDSNDGIKKPFRTLDKALSVCNDSDLRLRFLSAGVYPTTAQHFSNLSMHWDGTSADGNVIIDFVGNYQNKRIQFYNCYTHLKAVKIRWKPEDQLYFETGYCAIGDGSAFLSDVVRFNGMFMYADGASFHRLIVRESYAKLHNVSITKPSDGNAIHSRDSFLTVYGVLTINPVTISNEDSVIKADRGRLYISTAPVSTTGYQYGITCGNTELYIAPKYLDAFEKFTIKGNAITTPMSYKLSALEKRISEIEKRIF